MRKLYARPALATLLVLAVLASWGVWEWAGKNISLAADGQTTAMNSFASTVDELLQQQGMTLQPGDAVSPGLETRLRDGLEIKVLRAFPVNLAVEGQAWQVITLPVSVAKLLEHQKISLGPQDRVEPALEEVLQPGSQVRVVRVSRRMQVEEKSLPFREERRSEPKLEKGINRVVQNGKPGLERLTYSVIFEDGKEVKREQVKREVVRQPQNRIVAAGTITLASRGGQELRFSKALEAVSTAYTATGNRTYTGVYPRVGTIAVDPKTIPLGSHLYVEGYGYGVAQDIGSAIKGNRIDLYRETKKEALNWGRRRVKVYILEQ